MEWAVSADPDRFDEAVQWFEERVPLTPDMMDALGEWGHYEAFTIAGVTQLEVVAEVHRSLVEALAAGVPFKEWQETIASTLTDAWGRSDSFRLETIFRNAVQQAYNAGRSRQMRSPEVIRFRPFGLFDGISDGRQSAICKACDGTVLPLDNPWWESHTPQLHHRCRSRTVNITRAQAERLGISKAPPVIAADSGFGKIPDRQPWSPDAGDYPAELWEAFQQKRDELAARPRRLKRPKP